MTTLLSILDVDMASRSEWNLIFDQLRFVEVCRWGGISNGESHRVELTMTASFATNRSKGRNHVITPRRARSLKIPSFDAL